MRIKSKFHDYYDKCQALGQDQGLVFVRVPQELKLERSATPPLQFQWLTDALGPRLPSPLELQSTFRPLQRVACEPTITLFAGKLVAGMRVSCAFLEPILELGRLPADQFLYEHSRFTDALSALGCAQAIGRKHQWSSWRSEPRVSVSEFFASTGSTELLAAALEHQTPLASLTRENQGYRGTQVLRINPCLKDQEFFRHLDAWQAFQELSMFMGNLAAPERALPQCSDKDRAAKHGLDEWSFRTMPQPR